MQISGIKNSKLSFSGIHVSEWIPGNVREAIEDHEIFRANAGKYDINIDRFIFENSVNMTIEHKREKWYVSKIFHSLTDDLSEFVSHINKINSQEAFEALINNGWKRFLKIK